MMSSNRGLRVAIDQAAGVAYINFTDAKVVRTVEIVEDEIMLDLDAWDVAVGIEVLNFDADIPFQRLITDYHVPQKQVDVLRMIRPNMTSFLDAMMPTETKSVAGAVVPC